MKSLLAITFAALLPCIGWAHVGSPDTFFEGLAGNIPVSVIVPPPAALPGAAQISVTVNDPTVKEISAEAWMWPKPANEKANVTMANRVEGTTNMWTAEVWMLRPGAYTVRVRVVSATQAGEVLVPVNILPRGGQPMSTIVRAVLIGGGVLLMFVAGGVASGIARRNGASPYGAAVVTLLLMCVGAGAVGMRWRTMDAIFQASGISKPAPLAASIRQDGERSVMAVHPGATNAVAPWTALVPDHGKLMHLFLIKVPDSDVLAHLHPILTDGRTFGLEPPVLPGGEYEVYGEVTYRSGLSQSLLGKVMIPTPVGVIAQSSPTMTNANMENWCGSSVGVTNANAGGRDMDDSWHVDQGIRRPIIVPAGLGISSPLMGGYTLLFENVANVSAGREATMHFAAFDPSGREIRLQPYMGMIGHALVRRKDGSVLAHLHPGGSYSMAALEVIRGPQPSAKAISAAVTDINRVSFPYRFPKTGDYRVWVQVRIAGRVLTGVFDITVKS